MKKTIIIIYPLLLCLGVNAQDFVKQVKTQNRNLDSLASYSLAINTAVYRDKSIIEDEKIDVNISKLSYEFKSKYVNTYYNAKYQLIEDKMNEVYYLGINDSSSIAQGLTGRLADSLAYMVKSIIFFENDSVKIYQVKFNSGESDSVHYYFNKNSGLLMKQVLWIPDEEERYVGGKNINQNKTVTMIIEYRYGDYKKGKTIESIVNIKGDSVSLKNPNGWELLNMIPQQQELIRKTEKLKRK